MKLPLDVAIHLAKDGVIAGVKDSSGVDVSFRQLLTTSHIEGFSVFTGHEVVVDGALLGGAHGVVPGLGNVDPAGYRSLGAGRQGAEWTGSRLRHRLYP